jgi:hypothetical protein
MFVPVSVRRSGRPAPAIPVMPSSGPALPSAPSDLPRLCGCPQRHAGWRPSCGRYQMKLPVKEDPKRAAGARESHPLTGISPSPITPRYPPPKTKEMIVALLSAILIGQPVPDDAAQGQATRAVRSVALGRAAALTSSRLATTRRLRMSTASDPTLTTRSPSSRASATVFS